MQPNESLANDSSLPPGWPPIRTTARVIAAAGLMGLFTVGALVGAGVAATSGRPGPAALLVLAAVFLGHFVGLGISLSRRPTQMRPPPIVGRTDLGDPGLEIPYARGPYYWAISVTLLSALALAGIAVFFALAGSIGAIVVAVTGTVMAVTLGWIGVVFLQLAPGRIVLTPDGIYHRSLTFEHYVPWFAVKLDSTGRTAPGVPRAGDVAPLMAAVITHLAESAGNAVIGLKAAGPMRSASTRIISPLTRVQRMRPGGRGADARAMPRQRHQGWVDGP